MEIALAFQYLTFSYVVMVGGPGGHIDLDGKRLSRVFGSLGPGNVAQMPNGLAVVLGDYNQLIVQPPKISFKGATAEILFELYRNARRDILNAFAVHKATAFGINFELDVEFPDMNPREVLNRILSTQQIPAGMRLNQAMLQIDETRITIAASTREPERLLYTNFNNHIEKPEMSSFDYDTLRQQVESFRLQNERTLQEMYQCLQRPHA